MIYHGIRFTLKPGMFPCLPKQSGYHKRLKNVEPLLCKSIRP
jgi:hypothetical protein